MSGMKKCLSKAHDRMKRVLSLVLVFAMVLTLGQTLPGSTLTAQAADMNINLHVYNGADGGLGYDAVYLQGWQEGTFTVTNATSENFATWSCTRYKLTEEGNDWWGLTIAGTIEGFQFLNTDASKHTSGAGYDSNMAGYNGDLYYKNNVWYKDADCTTMLSSFESEPPFILVGDLPGTAWDQTADPNFVQDTSDTNKYSVTLNNVPAGNYSYKVLQNSQVNGWNKPWGNNDNRSYSLSAPANLTFSIDATDATMGVTVTPTYIKDLTCEMPTEIQKGKSITLPTTCTYYDGNGNQTADTAISEITVADTGATIANGELSLASNYAGSTVTVTVKLADGFTKDFTLNAVDMMYTFTINYYNPNVPDQAYTTPDLWIWENGGSGGNAGYPFTGTYEDTGNNITWLTQTISLPFNKLGIIGRLVAGDWDGGQDVDQGYELTSGDSATLWYVHGQGITDTNPTVTETEARYMILEYTREDANYDGWSLYTWNSGLGAAVTIDFEVVDGKGVAKVPIAANVESLSFCVKQTVGTDEWANKDGGDHVVATPLNQTVVKAKMAQGAEPELQYPYNVGYEMDVANNSTHFYYRDDAKYLDGTLSALTDVKVEVDGTEYAMTYDAATQRFVYTHEGLTIGDHTYRYNVGGSYLLDKFNPTTINTNGTDYSVYTYSKYEAQLTATLQLAEMNSKQNNVLTLTLSGNGLDTMVVTDAYVDASALGLSSKYAIDKELLAVSLSVKDTVAAGVKTLPITVVDQYGNSYTTTASVTVTEATADDFDWDEAIIYFMVTDRFFDGNASNNAANGADTYGTNEGLYHGGDFAGVTAKLDYLKDLGVNTIWITPIVDNIAGVTVTGDGSTDVPYNASYHGYWAKDFTKLDPALGTEAEFATLIDEAHARGMKIMVDVVVNHAGYGMETSDQYDGMIRDKVTSGNYILGDGQAGLPDFLTENESVRNTVIQWQVDWMTNYDIDYFRVDTVKHVDNTTWTAFKNALTKQNPEFKMIGEYYGAGYASTFENLGTGTMDSLLDFDFNNMASDFVAGKIDSVESYFESRNTAINNTATMGGFLSSHDEEGFLYSLKNTYGEEEAYAKAMVAASLQLTAKGQPVIYYGEEIGLSGANNYPYQTNRYDYDWTIANDDNEMLTHYKKMLAIRNDNTDVFAKGTRTKLAGSDADQYLAFERTYGSDSLVTVLNITDAEKTVSFKTNYAAGTVLNDLYNETSYTVAEDQTVSITVPAAADGGTVVLEAAAGSEGDDNTGDDNTGDDNTGDDNTGDDNTGDDNTGDDNTGDDNTGDGNTGDGNTGDGNTGDDDYRLVIPVTSDFTEVVDTIGKVSEGAEIIVVMAEGTTSVPQNVFTAVAGKDITLFFLEETDATWVWYIDGKEVTDKVANGISLDVAMDSKAISEDKVKGVAGDKKTKQISLAHDGEFGFTGWLTMMVGTEYAGKHANLFYHNEKTGELEYQGVDVVDKDGFIIYKFTHASDYVIVFADADMKPAGSNNGNTAVIKPNVSTVVNNMTTTGSPKTGDPSPLASAILVLMLGAAVVANTASRRRRAH